MCRGGEEEGGEGGGEDGGEEERESEGKSQRAAPARETGERGGGSREGLGCSQRARRKARQTETDGKSILSTYYTKKEIQFQVEVKAACNPQRILQPTKVYMAVCMHIIPGVQYSMIIIAFCLTSYIQASESRVLVDSQPQLHAQHPLFTLHGYRDNVVTSDPRFKVAAALRKAGLLGSKYARHTLSLVPPTHPPRPDQNSSVLK